LPEKGKLFLDSDGANRAPLSRFDSRARLDASGFDVSEVRDGRKPGTRVFSVRGGTCGVPTLILQPAEQVVPEIRRKDDR